MMSVCAGMEGNLREDGYGSIRLFVTDRLEQGAMAAAREGQARYLTTVMRRKLRDPVRLFNGVDGEWGARIVRVMREEVALLVEQQLRPQEPDCPDLWLAFALLKRDATDLVVQKATELGVRLIQPVISARTHAGRVNRKRLISIATEAAEQSERLTVPAIRDPVPLHRLLKEWPRGRMLYVAMERGNYPKLVVGDTQAAGLLVGPEGGWADEERQSLLGYAAARPVSLGRLVLRAETACLAGLVLLQAGLGR